MNARRWHRRLGWVAGAVALAWALTGFLHPVMSWTAPRAAVQTPPSHAAPVDGVVAPGPALAAQGVTNAIFVRLMPVGAGAVWFAEAADGRRVTVDAYTGAPAPAAERARAEDLARHYTGLADTPIVMARRLDVFSTTYPAVNRILPIWEVRFSTPDALTVMVDPKADRLVTVSNGPRRLMLAVFQNVHTLKFLEGAETVRIAAILMLVGSVLATTLIGVGLLLSGKGRGMRAVHRTIAWVAAPLVLAFTGSGLFHLVMTSGFSTPPSPRAAPFAVAELAAAPRIDGESHLDLVATRGGDGHALWRVTRTDSPSLFFDGTARMLSIDDNVRARELAGRDGAIRLVTRFDGAYGFVNKRLPVIGVGEGPDAVFVDARESLVAGRATTGLVAAEAWSFDTIHKWDMVADAIGRRNRDYLTMLAVALIALTAGFGLALLPRRAP